MMATMREKTRAVQRQHVLDAATSVFAEKGFRGATIRDVAVAAGVSDGTIYNLFDNKAALLHAILAGAVPPAPVPILPADADADAPLPILADLLRERWTALGPQSLAMLRVILSEALIDPEFRSLYRQSLLVPPIDQLGAMLAATSPHPDAQAMAAYDARLLTAQFLGLVLLRLLGDNQVEQDADALLDRLAAIIGSTLPLPASDSAGS
jgi:AcrR family transcriptional regulator